MASPKQPPPDSTSDPWYHEGLKFACTQCGNCCTGSPGYVWVTEEEIAAIARHLEKPIGEIRLMHTRPVGQRTSLRDFANGDCTFFDGRTRSCTIYPVRPVQCRTWPFWNSNLSSPEAWQEVGRTCPGVGKGDFVSLDEITERARQIDI
ncbi:Flagellin N-methylase [Maioricimonas rarisocia]|uniref:Flagellin N-methylase n=1 Tax=Maioricimonas rarisocia TaxID=2528026 RepID=A0A517ZFZ0_9PLAN|nr:YkgJ family cysteine cluster protein [Maioricimonas rarisocia]QDU41396.1 Flagellin N-methylase [Maioricimonas rarisocia]